MSRTSSKEDGTAILNILRPVGSTRKRRVRRVTLGPPRSAHLTSGDRQRHRKERALDPGLCADSVYASKSTSHRERVRAGEQRAARDKERPPEVSSDPCRIAHEDGSGDLSESERSRHSRHKLRGIGSSHRSRLLHPCHGVHHKRAAHAERGEHNPRKTRQEYGKRDAQRHDDPADGPETAVPSDPPGQPAGKGRHRGGESEDRPCPTEDPRILHRLPSHHRKKVAGMI